MHCQNPPCVALCPWGPAHQLENGIALIDSDICLGGSKCKSVCPWHIPERQSGVGIYMDILPEYAGNGVMYKCDRCYQKVAEGELPACIDICPEKVQKIGPRDEIIKEAHAIAQEIGGFIYGEKENGGTNTIYVSPVPFEELDKVIEKGPGKPHLKPVKDSMADSNNLVTALAIAPLAGIAGALGRFVSLAKKSGGCREKRPGTGFEGAVMMTGALEKYLKYVYLAAMTIITFTGLGQMPIMKRYYISDLPGLSWTSNFYIGLKVHYYAAIVLLFVLFYFGTGYLMNKTRTVRLSTSGAVRIGLLAAVLISGLLLLVNNLSGVFFSQNLRIVIDLIHISAVMVFLVYALVCLIIKSKWLKPV